VRERRLSIFASPVEAIGVGLAPTLIHPTRYRPYSLRPRAISTVFFAPVEQNLIRYYSDKKIHLG
jgi:hypothetical protein